MAQTAADLTLFDIRNCLEGVVPGAIATTGADGLPNVTYVSQALYVDDLHLALSFQFFNKTRENILFNPLASLLLMDPDTAARFRLQILYVRTEDAGEIFEKMRAKLSGIASHEGMEGVFVLQGADIYRVLSLEHLPGHQLPTHSTAPRLLHALHLLSTELQSATEMESLVDVLLRGLHRHFDLPFVQLWLADVNANKLIALASSGYPQGESTGAEIPFNVGVVGVAAQYQTAIRILFAAQEYAYTRSVRERAIETGMALNLEAEIPLPGLVDPGSQLAVPIRGSGQLLAVLLTESPQACAFGYDLEYALSVLAGLLGTAMSRLQSCPDQASGAERKSHERRDTRGAGSNREPLTIEYHSRDHAVFLDRQYLIKGLAGAIFWRLVTLYQVEQRGVFTNRELRRDRVLPLPDVSDNLEARLLLLRRRLAEKTSDLCLDSVGRGRLRLVVNRPLNLQTVPQ